MNTTELLWGVLFSSIGLGFFIYGRKQNAISPFVCGILLMIYPYFMPSTALVFNTVQISSTTLLVLVGIVLTAIPFMIRH